MEQATNVKRALNKSKGLENLLFLRETGPGVTLHYDRVYVHTHHDFWLDDEVLLSSNLNMFLHDTEVVEAADEEAAAVRQQIKIYIFTEIPGHQTQDH